VELDKVEFVVLFVGTSGVVKMACPVMLADSEKDRHVALAQVLMAVCTGVNVPLLVTMSPKIWSLP
jgi:hypothetical protein